MRVFSLLVSQDIPRSCDEIIPSRWNHNRARMARKPLMTTTVTTQRNLRDCMTVVVRDFSWQSEAQDTIVGRFTIHAIADPDMPFRIDRNTRRKSEPICALAELAPTAHE